MDAYMFEASRARSDMPDHSTSRSAITSIALPFVPEERIRLVGRPRGGHGRTNSPWALLRTLPVPRDGFIWTNPVSLTAYEHNISNPCRYSVGRCGLLTNIRSSGRPRSRRGSFYVRYYRP
jgi:hypothetical protein